MKNNTINLDEYRTLKKIQAAPEPDALAEKTLQVYDTLHHEINLAQAKSDEIFILDVQKLKLTL